VLLHELLNGLLSIGHTLPDLVALVDMQLLLLGSLGHMLGLALRID